VNLLRILFVDTLDLDIRILPASTITCGSLYINIVYEANNTSASIDIANNISDYFESQDNVRLFDVTGFQIWYPSQNSQFATTQNSSVDMGSLVLDASSETSTAIYLAIAVGIILLVVVIIVSVLCCCVKNKSKNKHRVAERDISTYKSYIDHMNTKKKRPIEIEMSDFSKERDIHVGDDAFVEVSMNQDLADAKTMKTSVTCEQGSTAVKEYVPRRKRIKVFDPDLFASALSIYFTEIGKSKFLKIIPDLIEKNKGKEERLCKKLMTKYGGFIDCAGIKKGKN
jgi:hypothetical protein